MFGFTFKRYGGKEMTHQDIKPARALNAPQNVTVPLESTQNFNTTISREAGRLTKPLRPIFPTPHSAKQNGEGFICSRETNHPGSDPRYSPHPGCPFISPPHCWSKPIERHLQHSAQRFFDSLSQTCGRNDLPPLL